MIACASVKGAPGATTTALALAVAWPDVAVDEVRPVVVEADVAGGDVAARMSRSHAPGLLDLAAAARRSHPGSVLGAAQELPFGVRAVLAPSGARQCREAVRLLATDGGRVLRGGEEDFGTVVLDVGRVGDFTEGVVAFADVVVLVTRAGVDGLAHVFACREALAAREGRVVLAVVGPCPFPADEIAEVVGIDRVVVLPWAPRSAAALGGVQPGRLRGSGWRRSALLAAAGELAAAVRLVASERAEARAGAEVGVR
ncbi:hypothetical protein D7319_06490 [Streptomyces radicis]|uniref:MinD-like ATPase involved in chromosome partitioning or flagellar assembly n=2 Tax=Streptomyces radicis TaxID=1750517 RepID=A0A3A9WFK6_9ACTN|nr:hypothetical protein D7319_06490 [Streptomyces radicis]RKN26412.1 hypothetical protein D7318_03170 [Streptomyces radicis]